MTELSFDTNIVIDALHERPQAWIELRRASRAWISRMTWIEILAGVPDAARDGTEEFLRLFAMSEIDEEVSHRAASIRHQRRALKVPDAIIFASAQVRGRILVTRNTKDFPANTPGIRIPYQL